MFPVINSNYNDIINKSFDSKPVREDFKAMDNYFKNIFEEFVHEMKKEQKQLLKKEVDSVKQECDSKIQDLEKKHNAQIQELEQRYNSQIKDLEQKYLSRMEIEKEHMKQEIEELQDTIHTLKKEQEESKEKNEEEVKNLKSTVDNFYQYLYKNMTKVSVLSKYMMYNYEYVFYGQLDQPTRTRMFQELVGSNQMGLDAYQEFMKQYHLTALNYDSTTPEIPMEHPLQRKQMLRRLTVEERREDMKKYLMKHRYIAPTQIAQRYHVSRMQGYNILHDFIDHEDDYELREEIMSVSHKSFNTQSRKVRIIIKKDGNSNIIDYRPESSSSRKLKEYFYERYSN